MIASFPDYSIQTREKIFKNFERNASDARKDIIESTEEALTEMLKKLKATIIAQENN